jgi:hypothetical protein
MPLLNPFNSNVFDVVTLNPANPGAGANLAYNCPDNCRLEILSCNFLFTADANVANRYITLSCTDATAIWGVSRSQVPHTAGLSWNYFFETGLIDEIDLSAGSILIEPLAYQVFLDVGTFFTLNVTNIQVGDALSGIYLRVKRWVRE